MLRVSQEQTAKRPVDCAVTGVGRSVGSGNGSENVSFFPMGKEIRQRDSGFGNGFILFFRWRELRRMS